jgi:Zn-dependent peptidase ImmA (M78 family)
VTQLNDNDKMKKGNSSQNQKSCKAETQANAFSAYLLCPTAPKTIMFTFVIMTKAK